MRLEALCPKRQPCQGPLLQGELWDTWNHSGVANFSMVGILQGHFLSQNHQCFRSCLDIEYIFRYSRYGCQRGFWGLWVATDASLLRRAVISGDNGTRRDAIEVQIQVDISGFLAPEVPQDLALCEYAGLRATK